MQKVTEHIKSLSLFLSLSYTVCMCVCVVFYLSSYRLSLLLQPHELKTWSLIIYMLYVQPQRGREGKSESLDLNVKFSGKQIQLGQLDQKPTDGPIHCGKKFEIMLYKQIGCQCNHLNWEGSQRGAVPKMGVREIHVCLKRKC